MESKRDTEKGGGGRDRERTAHGQGRKKETKKLIREMEGQGNVSEKPRGAGQPVNLGRK